MTFQNAELSVIPAGGQKEPLVYRSGNAYALGTPDSTTIITFIIENGAVTGFEADANGNKRLLKKIK